MTHDGIVVVDKPEGLTSHDVVHYLRKVFGTKKIGHAGTLDPMATGVLVIGINSATRLLGHLSLETKEYEATIRLGATSTTDDSQGDLSERADTSSVSDLDVSSALEGRQGTIWQVPSSISAKKVNGRRAYEIVRSGQEVKLAANEVHVESIQIHRISRVEGWIDVEISVTCSTGTFIRAIARDVGSDLGIGGHLTRLRRTRVGPFNAHEAVTLSKLQECENPWAHVMDMPSVAQQLWPSVVLNSSDRKKVTFGQRLSVADLPSEPLVALLDEDGTLLALASVSPEAMEYRAVFVGTS